MTGLRVAVGVGLLVGLVVSGLIFIIGGTLRNRRLLQIANLAVMAIASVGLAVLSVVVGFRLDGHVRNPMGIYMLVMSPISAVISLYAAWRLLFRSDTPGLRSEGKWILGITLVATVIFALVAYWALQPA
jgi:hypothetical protein